MSRAPVTDEQVRTSDATTERRIMVGVLAVIVASLWIRPMFSSLWLDELGSWWVVHDGLGDTVRRALEYHGQSPLYYSIAWFVAQVSSSEVVLRLPSVIAGFLSLVLVHRLATRLVDRKAALSSVVAFAGFGTAAFAFSDMRPYGLAIFLLTWSALAIVRWLDSGRAMHGVAVAVLAAAVVWGHFIFALALTGHVAYAVVRIRRRDTPVQGSALALVLTGTVIMLVPLAAQLSSIWSRRGSLSIPAEATVAGFVDVVVYPVAAGALVLGGLLAVAQGGIRVSRHARHPASLLFLSVWVLAPPVVLFLVSAFNDVVLLSPRYFVSIAPASAVAFGWFWSSIEPAVARRSIALVFAILSVGSFGSSLKAGEDWRGAAAFVRSAASQDTLVLLHPALIESTQLDWFDGAERESYMLSPVSYYAMTTVTEGLPFDMDEETGAYLESTILPEVQERDEFLIVTRYPFVPFRAWFDGRLGGDGWTSQKIGEFGVIEVIRFSRQAEV